jgi:hypothetical protein
MVLENQVPAKVDHDLFSGSSKSSLDAAIRE